MKAELDSLELQPILQNTVAGPGDLEKAAVKRRNGQKLLESIRDIQERVAAMPVLDPRPSDNIIGYNEYGVFD